jgi:hypothetical protein
LQLITRYKHATVDARISRKSSCTTLGEEVDVKVQIGMMVDGFDAIITFEVLETAVEVRAD